MRITRDEMLMAIAQIAAKRSTCERAKVGAVIARSGRVISTGYAGAPSGVDHCIRDHNCFDDQPCTRTIHAEANAIAFAARHGVSSDGASLYCTLSPCIDCAKLIINSGIKEVFYGEAYRKTEGVDLLESVGIKCRKF